MILFGYHNGEKEHYTSLYEALYLKDKGPVIISIIGAGGKTTTMYALGQELANKRLHTIITTSTKIYIPSIKDISYSYNLICTKEINNVIRILSKSTKNDDPYVTICGTPFFKQTGKLASFPKEEIYSLANYCDILLIEADGARSCPLKIPYPHEPVIITNTNITIICVGLDCIGKKYNEVCYNYSKALSILQCQNNDRLVQPDDIVKLIVDQNGLTKGIPASSNRIVVLNKADTSSEVTIDYIAKNLYLQGNIDCIITSYKGDIS